MIQNKSCIAIIPAYNEEKTIGDLLRALKKVNLGAVVVVDDGSTDRTGELAFQNNAVVLKHVVNMGVGAATKTGLQKANFLKADYIITLDADGQHRADDVKALISKAIAEDYDMVIGKRRFSRNQLYNRIINFLADLLNFLILGKWVYDTQSGLRILKAQEFVKLNLTAQDYAISSEIVMTANRHNLKIGYLDIPAIYTSYSTAKPHRQKLGNALKMIKSLLKY